MDFFHKNTVAIQTVKASVDSQRDLEANVRNLQVR
jgi:hypothetical protein